MTAVCKTWNLPAVSFKPLCNNLYQPTGDNTSCPVCVTPAVPPGNCVVTKQPPYADNCSGAIQFTKTCACQALYGDYVDGNPGFVGTFVDTYTKIWKLTVTTTPVWNGGPSYCDFAGTYYLYESQPGIGRCIGVWRTKQRYQQFSPVDGVCVQAGINYPLWQLRWQESSDNNSSGAFILNRYTKNWSTGQLEQNEWWFGFWPRSVNLYNLKDKVCKGATYFPWTNRIGINEFVPRSRFIQFYDMTIEGL